MVGAGTYRTEYEVVYVPGRNIWRASEVADATAVGVTEEEACDKLMAMIGARRLAAENGGEYDETAAWYFEMRDDGDGWRGIAPVLDLVVTGTSHEDAQAKLAAAMESARGMPELRAADILANYDVVEFQESGGQWVLAVSYPGGITATGATRDEARDNLMYALVRYWNKERISGNMPADFNPWAPHKVGGGQAGTG
jgi:predicted RNase H-like HicB family nuclease